MHINFSNNLLKIGQRRASKDGNKYQLRLAHQGRSSAPGQVRDRKGCGAQILEDGLGSNEGRTLHYCMCSRFLSPPQTDCQDQKKKKKRFNVVSNDKVVMGGFHGRLYITCKV